MSKKVYVASHCRGQARLLASHLIKNAGCRVVSTWINKPFKSTKAYKPSQCENIALDDFSEVCSCDFLVLISGPDKYAGGKFVEAGIAMGIGKPVLILGRRENMLLWHPSVHCFCGEKALLRHIKAMA